MNWRSLFGALYAEDVFRLSPRLTFRWDSAMNSRLDGMKRMAALPTTHSPTE